MSLSRNKSSIAIPLNAHKPRQIKALPQNLFDALEVQTLEIIFIFKTATPEKPTARVRVYACCSRKKSPPLTIPRRI